MVTIKLEYISSYDKIQKLPSDVLFVFIMSAMNTPIGSDIFNRTIEKYPEYFNFDDNE